MNNEELQQIFKGLLYDFGEINWNILTSEAWDKYINQDEPFTEIQLQDLRDTVERIEEILKTKI